MNIRLKNELIRSIHNFEEKRSKCLANIIYKPTLALLGKGWGSPCASLLRRRGHQSEPEGPRRPCCSLPEFSDELLVISGANATHTLRCNPIVPPRFITTLEVAFQTINELEANYDEENQAHILCQSRECSPEVCR